MVPRLLGHGRDAVAEVADHLLDLLARAIAVDPQAQGLGSGADRDFRDARHAGERGFNFAGAGGAVRALNAIPDLLGSDVCRHRPVLAFRVDTTLHPLTARGSSGF